MTAPHWDHDIHGPVIEVGPGDRLALDEDCDCPPDCRECDIEGVYRGTERNTR